MYNELSIRMKTFYEQIPKIKLIRRMPVIIRLDGKAFHTFTKGFKKPFDEILIKTMQETTKYLCENIQGCVLVLIGMIFPYIKREVPALSRKNILLMIKVKK